MRDDGADQGGRFTNLPAPPLLRRSQALFLDFDGTLVAIAATPGLVRVTPELPELLEALSLMLDRAVAVVSGRPIDDLERVIAPFSGALAGQHGLERRDIAGATVRAPSVPALASVRPRLAQFATRHDGVILEDKGCSLALHYRQAPGLACACKALVRSVAEVGGGAFQFIDGKMVAELIPRQGGKGRAIAAFLAEPPFYGRTPVFVGDDTTDEDGFAVVNELGGTSVHVGPGPTAARCRFAGVGDVLAWFVRSLER
jgi:trehalose 6-phosphate phosphatase